MKVGDLVRFTYDDDTMIVLQIIGHGCNTASQVTAMDEHGTIVKSSVASFKVIDTRISDH